MSVKKLFETKRVTKSATTKQLTQDVESANYIDAYLSGTAEAIPHIDFSDLSNFVKFASAESHYEHTIEKIYTSYPYDGSNYERQAWHNSASFFDKYVFEHEYPRTTGYVHFSKDGWGSSAGTLSTISSDNKASQYALSDEPEYILLYGGPHINTLLDEGKQREANLKLDGNKGNTVEFWLKKPSFPTTSKREVVFDLYATSSAGISAPDYGRLTIELSASSDETESIFYLTYMSGTRGAAQVPIGGTSVSSSVADKQWHHYAFTFQNTEAKAIHFDGINDRLQIGTGAQWDALIGAASSDKEYTLSAWVKPTQLDHLPVQSIHGDLPDLARIFEFGASDLVVSVGKRGEILIFRSFDSNGGMWRTGRGVIDVGNWHHVAVTHDTSATNDPILYIDGAATALTELMTPAGNVTTITNVKNAHIGSNYENNRPFKGYMDEVSIFDSALSATEITELYNNGEFTNLEAHSKYGDLRSWYRMGESTKGLGPVNFVITDEKGAIDAHMQNFTSDYGIKIASDQQELEMKLYVDGQFKDYVVTGSSISAVTASAAATIGSLVIMPSASSGWSNSQDYKGYGKLSGSLDEFRFWKTHRTPEQIGRYWFTPVGAGTNTDDSNTDLGVYYKFNEGVTGTGSYDETVLDYSGRVSNGKWTGYTSGSRSTNSAIVESSASAAEFKDPIIYSFHPYLKEWRAEKIAEGRTYDYRNNAGLYHTFPEWISTDEENLKSFHLKQSTQVIASYLDSLWMMIDTLPKIRIQIL